MKTLKESLLADIEDTLYNGTAYAETIETAQKELDTLLSDYRITTGGFRAGNGKADIYGCYRIRAKSKQHNLAKYLLTECANKEFHSSWDKIYTVEIQFEPTAAFGVNKLKIHFFKVCIFKDSNKILYEAIIPFEYPAGNDKNIKFAINNTSVSDLIKIIIYNLKYLLHIDNVTELATLMKLGMTRKL